MTESSRLFTLLDQLIDAWCERRALGPLSVLLPAYPPAPLHTDQWAALFAAIRNLKGVPPGTLSEQEGACIAEAHALVYHLLKGSAAGTQILASAG